MATPEVHDDKGADRYEVALDDARARELRVTPSSSFFGAYIDRHPEYADLVGT